jgi:hypothetical protein
MANATVTVSYLVIPSLARRGWGDFQVNVYSIMRLLISLLIKKINHSFKQKEKEA